MDIKTETITVTSVQDLLVWTHGNQTAVSKKLGVHRSTVKKILDENKEHVVTIKGNVYSLLSKW